MMKFPFGAIWAYFQWGKLLLLVSNPNPYFSGGNVTFVFETVYSPKSPSSYPGTPRPTIYKWLFQLDDSQSLHRKWLEITKHLFINGCLGFQDGVYIYCLENLGIRTIF